MLVQWRGAGSPSGPWLSSSCHHTARICRIRDTCTDRTFPLHTPTHTHTRQCSPLHVCCPLFNKVGSGVLVRPVDNQLPHELYVGWCHSLRVRQDLGHMHRDTHLEGREGREGMGEEGSREESGVEERRAVEENGGRGGSMTPVPGQSADWGQGRLQFCLKSQPAFPTDCHGSGPASPSASGQTLLWLSSATA